MALTACQLEELLEHLANGLCSVDANGQIRTLSDDLKDIRDAIVAGAGGVGGEGGEGGEGGAGGGVIIGGSVNEALNNLVQTNVALINQNQQLVGQMSDLVTAFCEPCEDARGRALARIKQIKTEGRPNIELVDENALAASTTRRLEKTATARNLATAKVALPAVVGKEAAPVATRALRRSTD